MSILLLDSGDPLWLLPGGGSLIEVKGQGGSAESLAFSTGSRVELDSSFNRGEDNLYIQGSSSDFTVSRSGAVVTLSSTDGLTSLEIPAGPGGQNLVFGDGALTLKISSGKVLLGSQEITANPGAVTASPDASSTSGAFFDGGSNPQPGATEEVSVDVGTAQNSVELSAAGKNYTYLDNAEMQGNVEISNFQRGDKIRVSNAASSDYSISNDGEDVYLTYNNNGTLNQIVLIGVVAAEALIYDEATLESAMGFDVMNFA